MSYGYGYVMLCLYYNLEVKATTLNSLKLRQNAKRAPNRIAIKSCLNS